MHACTYSNEQLCAVTLPFDMFLHSDSRLSNVGVLKKKIVRSHI